MRRPLIGMILSCWAAMAGAQQVWAVAIVDGYDPGFSTDPAPFAAWILGGHVVEDSNDRNNDSRVYLGPGYGGQRFDVEFLSVGQDPDSFDINIATGQRQDNGFNNYCPGDILLLLDDGHYIGIEVGGGLGGAVGSSGIIQAGDPGSFYTVDSNGFTATHQLTDPAQSAGSVWENPLLSSSPLVPSLVTQFIGQPGGLLGIATYSYVQNPAPDVHAVIQVEIPLSFLSGHEVTRIWWGPACGNDVLTIARVPEPTSGFLAASGLLILLGLVRRRR